MTTNPAAKGIVGCRHGSDPARPQPCPPMCPVQEWPRSLFRFGWFHDGWVLRRKNRHLATEWEERHRRWRADQ